MVRLTEEIEASLNGAKTAFLATSSRDGTPNVVPIAAYTVLEDGRLLISDQYFNKTLQNMRENPRIALTWWGAKGGFQVKGTVTLHADDEVFARNVAWMRERWPAFTPKSAVLVTITDAYIVKPDPEPGKRIL